MHRDRSPGLWRSPNAVEISNAWFEAVSQKDKVRTKGLAPLPAISSLVKDDFSTHADHVVLKPKKKRFEPGKPLDLSKAICYDSDESSEGDLFDDLEVLGEEG